MSGTLRKNLSLIDATALVMGSMIGSGIFIVSADMARTLGSPGWLLIAWAVTGVLTVIAALSYGELAGMMPKAGGQYVYLREAYNPLSGFLYGWTLFMVIQTGTIAAVAMAFGKFLGVMLPWFSEKNIFLSIGPLNLNTVHIAAIGSIMLLTFLNTYGIKAGKYIQNTFTLTKIIALLGFIIAGLILAGNRIAVENNASYFWDAASVSKDGVLTSLSGFAIIAALGTALVGSLFSADAWNNVTFTGAEIRNPGKNIPLSLFLGTFIVCIVYFLANLVYLQALPLKGSPEGSTVIERGMQFAVNDRLGSAAMGSLLGNYAGLIMAVLVVISTFGCNNGLILSGGRVYYAMAGDGLFFRKAASLNRHDVPSVSLWVQCIWAGILCLTGTYSDLLDYVVFSVLIFYVMTIGGIFILRRKNPQAHRPYKAFGYPVLPALYILAAVFIMVVLLIYKPMFTWPGLVIVLLGIPVYYVWKKIAKQDEI